MAESHLSTTANTFKQCVRMKVTTEHIPLDNILYELEVSGTLYSRSTYTIKALSFTRNTNPRFRSIRELSCGLDVSAEQPCPVFLMNLDEVSAYNNA